MSVPVSLLKLDGNWAGQNRLWLSPSEPEHVSETTASVTLVAQGKFIKLHYTWADGGRPQDGCLLIGQQANENLARAVWVDSWHMGDQAMLCQGRFDPQGSLSVQGTYPTPPGPDWGWRIDIDPGGGNALRIIMTNLSPDGNEYLAVQAVYHRQAEVEIIPYQERWPEEFRTIGSTLSQGLGELALRIDHIGSTSVPGLAAKDVIDIQITVAALDRRFLAAMLALGYTQRERIQRDHRPAQAISPDTEWEKWYFREPAGQRHTHTHVRVQGYANQRYPLLFRDYLRAHPATAESYAELKRRLAEYLADSLTYPEVKDPAVDLIYLAAEEWAATTRWELGPSDA